MTKAKAMKMAHAMVANMVEQAIQGGIEENAGDDPKDQDRLREALKAIAQRHFELGDFA